jgi:phosphoribosyl 1,2-cyclic phosphodiesterase
MSEEAYLRFWGVRGSYAAPFKTHLGVGGNTSCVEFRDGDHILICDAGTGAIPLGEALVNQTEVRELLILLTHYHWDHICGLPFFLPAFRDDWTIAFFGPGERKEEVEKRLAAQMKAPYFPVETEHWTSKVRYLDTSRESIAHGPFRITHRPVHHPGATYGYRIEVRDKTVAYVSDNEFRYLETSIEEQYETFDAFERPLLDDLKDEVRISELKVIQDADIVIHDAQYTPQDYRLKRGWGHSCYVDTVNCAMEANVKELYLYHHDPNYDDDAIEAIYQHALEMIAATGSPMRCHIAREGLQIPLT